MVDPSAERTMQLSRGGLYLINNKTYLVFYAMEMKIHQHFTATSAPRIEIYHNRVHLIDEDVYTVLLDHCGSRMRGDGEDLVAYDL